jgi:signal transduction histidine kinase
MWAFSPKPDALPAISISVAVVAIVWAAIYSPLQQLMTRLAERLIPRTGYDLDERLREYSLAIGNIIDLDQLAAVTVGSISDVLNVQQAALIVADELVDETERRITLRPLGGTGDFPLQSVSFDFHDPLIEHLQEKHQLLMQRHVEQDTAFQNLLPQVQEWLRQMGMEIYVPIFANTILLGILAAGPPRSGEPFGRQEQTFLTALANQTAIALQNARMFENMRELNFDIIQLNEDLRRANARAERLDRAKKDFLTIASHELRTPLTHVKGYADVLAELSAANAITQEQIASITDNIGRATDRLETIIKAIVDLSQIEEDELNLHLSSTTLKAVMRMALQAWMKPVQIRRQQLLVEGVEEIPPIVADLHRLSQAFGNLISNAVKYTPDGGVIVVRAQMINGELYEVVVSDTGVGIDPQDQALIFDKFFHVGDADRHSSSDYNFKGGGPGLGLAITRGVIEAHGGRIWVVSQGRDETGCPGSAFHVVLPLKAKVQVKLPQQPADAGKVMPFTVATNDS